MKLLLRTGLILTVMVSVLSPIKASAATTYSFTNASATGRSGPTQPQVTSAYTSTTLSGSVTVTSQGIQDWIVPATGRYSIQAVGAAGGGDNAGRGASIYGEFSLTQGNVIRVVVGQRGISSSNFSGGGGGGSFVWLSTSTAEPLIAAGGGGGDGGGSTKFGQDASTTTSGVAGTLGAAGAVNTPNGAPGTGGTNGSAGVTFDANGNCWDAAAGAGWKGNSTTAAQFCGTANFALSPLNGGTGGASFSLNGNNEGGFGGGGGGGGDAYSTASVGAGGGGYSGGGNGSNDSSSDRGAGGGGGSFNSGSNVSSSIYSSRTQGFVTITSLGPSLTTFSPTTTITNSSNITYNITFSEAVTGLAASDFSKSGTGSSTCTIGSPSGSGTTYTVILSGCSPGTVILTMTANAVTNADLQTAPSTNTAASTVVIDQTAPTISLVSAPSNSTYFPGNALNFTVNFSESVTVSGTPRLTLTVGSLTKYATFVSLTDSKTATFRYTVATASGEFDTDGIAVSTTLDLNSGAIADLATNALSPLTFTAPTLTSVLVAQTPAAPTITSITPSNGALSVAFTAGASNGSSITNYQYSTDNGSNWTTRSPVATTSPISISGLTNGTAYNVRIRAVNGAGNGDSSTAVSATPSAVVITGDATLTTTYGSAASTTTYTSTGGTSPYTYTLSATPSGVSISGGVVTASASTAAGTYTQNVIATDSAGTPQTGLKQLVITVNKASTTITIALPNSATDAPLGGAITITATVSQAGSVNFKLGGSSISGCSSVSSSAGTATCSWTPGALGGASLTAVLTPSDSTNYEVATTTTLSVTVVNGVTTVSLSLAGGVTQAPKGQNIVITATVDQAGRISFFADGKRIAGCYNKAVSGSTKTCTWKPAVQKQVTLTSTLNPTNSAYSSSTGSLKVWVVRRTGTR
ncbi:Fibronectin type III [Candidatus Nanopelagicaceae bacterium]